MFLFLFPDLLKIFSGLYLAAFMLMAHPLESSRTWSQLVFHTQRTSPWGYIQASGTLMTGPLEEVWSRQIGPKLPLLLHTGISMLIMLAFGGLRVLLLAVQIQTQRALSCSHNNWTPQAKRGFNGCKRITWFIITAQTQSDSRKAFL